MIQSFRDLVVWQRSVQIAIAVYQLTRMFPKEETYGLVSQIRRAAVSIPSNIAEGHGRMTSGEYKQFLGIARGSNFELQTQIEIARSLGFGESEKLKETEVLSHQVGKMIFGILEGIREMGRGDN